MRIHLIAVTAIAASWLASCKEQPVSIDAGTRSGDTTYVAPVETADPRKILVEELSGVTCVNCPAGADQLKGYNEEGTYKDRLVIVTIHAGDYTRPISKEGYQNAQDFRTTAGSDILTQIFLAEPGKPCAGFDRLPIASVNVGAKILDDKSKWASMLAEADKNTSSPVNIKIQSEYMAEGDFYDVMVRVAFTQAVSQRLALTVLATESGIKDVQQFPDKYEADYEFSHVLRTALSVSTGDLILEDMPTKPAGQVIEQHYKLKIDRSDAKQQFWKPENMEVVAFVSVGGETADRKVYQVASGHLAE